MPIRINLFAESQALEEIRRKDPVKRAIWLGICIIIGVLVYSSSLQVKILSKNGQLASLEGKLDGKTNEYSQALDNQRKLADIKYRLSELNQLAANRFLQATLLDAFQHCLFEEVQVKRMRTEQGYEVVPETPPVKLESGKTIPGRPGYATERIKLFLDAVDGSPNPGIVQVNKFKDTIAQTHYFQDERIKSNSISLKSISQVGFDPDKQKAFVMFSLECMYPDHVH